MEKHVRVETANPVVGQVPIRTQRKKKKKIGKWSANVRPFTFLCML